MPYGLNLIAAPAAEPLTKEEVKSWLRIDSDDTTQDYEIAGLIQAAREYAENRCGRALVTQTWQLTLDRFPSLFWVGSWGNSYQDYQGYQGPSQGAGQGNWQWTLDGKTIRVPKPPLQKVTAIQYTATDGTQQALAATTVSGSISAGTQTVTPASMAGITAGATLLIDVGASQEVVIVSAVTATTFTAPFTLAHTGPFVVQGFVAATSKTPGLLSPIYGLAWPIAQAGYEAVRITFVAGYSADGSLVPEVIKRGMKLLIAHWYGNREAVMAGTMGEVPLGVESLLGAGWSGEYV